MISSAIANDEEGVCILQQWKYPRV